MFLDSFYNCFIKDIHLIYSNYLAISILTVFLIFNTITDIKNLKIYNSSNILLLFSRIILALMPGFTLDLSLNNLYGMIFSWLVVLIPAMIFMFKMGGDIKLITVIGFYLGIYLMPLFIVLSLTSALLFGYIKHKIKGNVGKIPLAPFFLCGHVLLLIINLFV